MAKAIVTATYYQLLTSLRIKQAVFFTLFFPVFTFVLFGMIWGEPGDQAWIQFILTGIAGATVMNDALFSVGPVLKIIYANGYIKYVNKLPNPQVHFIGMIFSRLLFLTTIILLMNVIAWAFFGLPFSLLGFGYQFLGILIGLPLFGFVSLCLSFLNLKAQSDRSIVSLFYFITVFTSNAFYPIDLINPNIGVVGKVLPLDPILHLMRMEPVAWWQIALWLGVSMSIFFFAFRRFQVKR